MKPNILPKTWSVVFLASYCASYSVYETRFKYVDKRRPLSQPAYDRRVLQPMQGGSSAGVNMQNYWTRHPNVVSGYQSDPLLNSWGNDLLYSYTRPGYNSWLPLHQWGFMQPNPFLSHVGSPYARPQMVFLARPTDTWSHQFLPNANRIPAAEYAPHGNKHPQSHPGKPQNKPPTATAVIYPTGRPSAQYPQPTRVGVPQINISGTDRPFIPVQNAHPAYVQHPVVPPTIHSFRPTATTTPTFSSPRPTSTPTPPPTLSETCGYQDVDLTCGLDEGVCLREYPWLALLYSKTHGEKITCTGALIHPQYVLASAHCVDDLVKLRFGENDLGTKADCTRGVVKVCKEHVDINQADVQRNGSIALVRLAEPVPEEFASPICLPVGANGEINDGRLGILVGWGKTDAAGLRENPRRSERHQAKTRITSCSPGTLPESSRGSEFCAEDKVNAAGECVADSGAPLMTPGVENDGRWYLLGLDVGLRNECRADAERRFHDVRKWVDWIKSIIPTT